MAESGTNTSSYGSSRYPYYYGPEGRLVLVDSALEAVNRGSTTIGIKTPNFAVITSHIKPTKPLAEPADKIFTIDTHIGATGSGYIGDILQLIDEMQIASQKYRLTYEGPIDVNSLAKHLSAYLHNYTIYAVRPQAASMIISGRDQTGIQLYQVDPSGTFFKGSGFAIGQYSDIALDIIQREYRTDMNLEEAVGLSNRAVEKSLGNKPLVQTGVVSIKDGAFKRLTNN